MSREKKYFKVFSIFPKSTKGDFFLRSIQLYHPYFESKLHPMGRIEMVDLLCIYIYIFFIIFFNFEVPYS